MITTPTNLNLSPSFSFFKFSYLGRWREHMILHLQKISNYCAHHPQITLSIIITANTIFLISLNLFANWLERRVESNGKILDIREQNFNDFLINKLLTGFCVFTFNLILIRSSRYPLGKMYLTIITVLAVITRLFLRHGYHKVDQKNILLEDERIAALEKVKQLQLLENEALTADSIFDPTSDNEIEEICEDFELDLEDVP